jgi:hypothetical protein
MRDAIAKIIIVIMALSFTILILYLLFNFISGGRV